MRDNDGDGLGDWAEFGTAAGIAASPATDGFGDAPAGGAAGEPASGSSGLGDAPDLDGLPPVPARSGFGDALREGTAAVRGIAPPPGYHNTVDADGDGHDDSATYLGDGHGGAEILVDLDGDGRTDFIGHDTDRDNRVDFADYDKDHDGFFEKRMYDDDNDGFLDRSVWTHDS